MEYILTKQDYEDMRVLIAVSESILENYQILVSLEIAGKKETAEYQRTMEELRSTMGMEPTLYSRLGNDFSKLNSMVSYFQSMANDDLEKNGLESIIESKNNDMVIERIVRKMASLLSLKHQINQDMKFLIRELELDEEDEIVEQMLTSLNTEVNFIEGSMAVMKSIEFDKYACFLSVLKKMTESPFYRDMRSQFIMVKYRMAFVYDKIEEMMLRQNFEVLPQVYLQANCVGQIQKQDESITAMVLEQSSIQTIKSQTEILLSDYNNTILSNKEKKVEAFTRLCMLRAGLLFLSPECVSRENEFFHGTIDSEKYLQEHPQNSEIEQMIQEAYRQYKSDRYIPIQVSFIK